MKQKIYEAIRDGMRHPHEIIPALHLETQYTEFCKAIAELQQERKIIYKRNRGYMPIEKTWKR